MIDTLKLDPETAACGYPILCPGEQPHFVKPVFPNPYIADILGVQDEIDIFMEDANKAFKKTGAPPMPLMLHHFCLPFSPLCCIFGCRSRRRKALEGLISDWNNTIGIPRGLFLEWNVDYDRYFNQGNKFIITVISTLLASYLVSAKFVLNDLKPP